MFGEQSRQKQDLVYKLRELLCFSSKKTQKELFFKLECKGCSWQQSFLEDCKAIIVKAIIIILRDKINLSENGQIIESDLETTEVLNNSFSNIIKNLDISKFSDYETFIDNILL